MLLALTVRDFVPIIGIPVVQLTTVASTVLLVLLGTFLALYTLTLPWFRSPEGRFLVGFVFVSFLFSLRGWVLRVFRDFPGSEWVSFWLIVADLVLVAYLLVIFLRGRHDGGRTPHRKDPRP